jgi:hypothetical protein
MTGSDLSKLIRQAPMIGSLDGSILSDLNYLSGLGSIDVVGDRLKLIGYLGALCSKPLVPLSEVVH